LLILPFLLFGNSIGILLPAFLPGVAVTIIFFMVTLTSLFFITLKIIEFFKGRYKRKPSKAIVIVEGKEDKAQIVEKKKKRIIIQSTSFNANGSKILGD